MRFGFPPSTKSQAQFPPAGSWVWVALFQPAQHSPSSVLGWAHQEVFKRHHSRGPLPLLCAKCVGRGVPPDSWPSGGPSGHPLDQRIPPGGGPISQRRFPNSGHLPRRKRLIPAAAGRAVGQLHIFSLAIEGARCAILAENGWKLDTQAQNSIWKLKLCILQILVFVCFGPVKEVSYIASFQDQMRRTINIGCCWLKCEI